MRSFRTFSLFVVSFLLMTAAGLASAQEGDPTVRAAALAEQAVDLFEAGDTVGAINLFHEAVEEVPDPAFAFNLAQLYDSIEQLPQAQEWYNRYLELYPGAENAQDVEERIDEIDDEMPLECARLLVTTQPPGAAVTVEINGRDHAYGQSPVDGYVASGMVTIRANLRGFDPIERTINAVAGVRLEVDFGHLITEVDPESIDLGSITGWSLIGLGAVGALGGIIKWLDGESYSEDHNALVQSITPTNLVSEADLNALAKDAEDSMSLGNLLFGVGVTAIVGGVVVLLLSGDSEDEPEDLIGLVPLNDGYLLSWSGRF